MSTEEWKFHPESMDYEFSSYGRIRSYRIAGWPSKRREIPVSMEQKPDKKGYLRIRFNGKYTGVHRLITETFTGPAPTDKHQAAHRNGNPADNRPENLYWATNSENSLDKVRHGTHNWQKLSDDEAKGIKEEYALGYGLQRQIAERYGIARSTVSEIISGKKHAI